MTSDNDNRMEDTSLGSWIMTSSQHMHICTWYINFNVVTYHPKSLPWSVPWPRQCRGGQRRAVTWSSFRLHLFHAETKKKVLCTLFSEDGKTERGPKVLAPGRDWESKVKKKKDSETERRKKRAGLTRSFLIGGIGTGSAPSNHSHTRTHSVTPFLSVAGHHSQSPHKLRLKTYRIHTWKICNRSIPQVHV